MFTINSPKIAIIIPIFVLLFPYDLPMIILMENFKIQDIDNFENVGKDRGRELLKIPSNIFKNLEYEINIFKKT